MCFIATPKSAVFPHAKTGENKQTDLIMTSPLVVLAQPHYSKDRRSVLSNMCAGDGMLCYQFGADGHVKTAAMTAATHCRLVSVAEIHPLLYCYFFQGVLFPGKYEF